MTQSNITLTRIIKVINKRKCLKDPRSWMPKIVDRLRNCKRRTCFNKIQLCFLHRTFSKIIDVKCLQMNLVGVNHMSNRSNTIQKELNKFLVWMDIKSFMEQNKEGQPQCKLRTWTLCKWNTTTNTTVKVEVTDKRHQVPIYKEMLTWIDMLRNMVKGTKVQVYKRNANGAAKRRTDRSLGPRRKRFQAFLVSHQLVILKILKKSEIDLSMRNSWRRNINLRTENSRRPMSNSLPVFEIMKRLSSKWNWSQIC